MMQKRKILFICNISKYLYIFRINVIRELVKRGYEVIAVALEDEFSRKFSMENVKFIALRHLDRKSLNFFKNFKLFIEIFNIYKKEKPDLIFHYSIKINILGNIIARILNIKSISMMAGLGILRNLNSFKGFLVIILYKVAFNYVKKVFFLNNDDINFFISKRIIPRYKVIYIKGEGINLNYYSPDFCKNISKKQNIIIFLLISRLLWNKGIREYIEAIKIVKKNYHNTEFWLLGPIDTVNPTAIPYEIIKSWEEDNLIRYLGVTDDVRPYICQSDVVVLPSYYGEGLPRSLLEAISMGKPIITTNSVGCKEVVEDGKNGFLVPVKDSKALAEAMIKFIELPKEEKEKMGRESREKAIREFDEKIIINVYLEVIKQVLEKEN